MEPGLPVVEREPLAVAGLAARKQPPALATHPPHPLREVMHRSHVGNMKVSAGRGGTLDTLSLKCQTECMYAATGAPGAASARPSRHPPSGPKSSSAS